MIFTQPIAFEIGFLHVRWYSLAYIFGSCFAVLCGLFFDKKSKNKIIYNKIQFSDISFCVLVGIIIGGRLGYVLFYNFFFYFSHPFEIFKIWKGGMSFHGGFIGALISAKILSSKVNVKFLQMTDLLTVGVPFALMMGRLSNFANSELYGRKTNFFMGVVFDKVDEFTRHPTQLYEAFFEGIVLFIINLILYPRYKHKRGFISGNFVFLYGIIRFVLEFYREPDSHLGFFFGFMTMGQILSIPIIILGLFISTKSLQSKFN